MENSRNIFFSAPQQMRSISSAWQAISSLKGQELSSEWIGVFIFSFWVIMNGLIVIASCLSLYFRELNQE